MQINVAVGILKQDGKYLIAERPSDKYLGGLWEFSGGKIEPNETALAALSRELWEELRIEVITAIPYKQISHDYGDRHVSLEVFLITEYAGTPIGAEGQKIQWVTSAELSNFQFPPANQPIVDSLTRL